MLNKNNIQIFQTIETERLLLRQLKESDSNVILFLRSDKTVNQFIERPPNRQTNDTVDAINHIIKLNKEIESNKSFSWGITLKSDPEVIGTICLWNFSNDSKTAEIGYDLSPQFQKKGIMTEALKHVLHFGFKELNLNKIEAFTHLKNENSKALLINNGFCHIESRKDNSNLSNIIFEIKKN